MCPLTQNKKLLKILFVKYEFFTNSQEIVKSKLLQSVCYMHQMITISTISVRIFISLYLKGFRWHLFDMERLEILLKIKLRRITLGKTQAELAESLGLDRSQYTRIESGKTDVGLKNLIKIMDKLDMAFADFSNDTLPKPTLEHEIYLLKREVSKLKKRR